MAASLSWEDIDHINLGTELHLMARWEVEKFRYDLSTYGEQLKRHKEKKKLFLCVLIRQTTIPEFAKHFIMTNSDCMNELVKHVIPYLTYTTNFVYTTRINSASFFGVLEHLMNKYFKL